MKLVQIKVPVELLERLDVAADERGWTRSQLTRELLRITLSQMDDGARLVLENGRWQMDTA